MILGVLEAVTDDGRVVVRLGHDGQQLGLGAGLEAEPVLASEVEDLLDDVALLVHLDRIDADVASFVAVLVDGGLEGVVDVAEAMPQDVGEPQEHRQGDAAQLQMVGELLQVDRARRVFRRVRENVAVLRDREVALAPTIHLVEFRGVADGKEFTRLPRTRASCRDAHWCDDTQIFSRCIRCARKICDPEDAMLRKHGALRRSRPTAGATESERSARQTRATAGPLRRASRVGPASPPRERTDASR